MLSFILLLGHTEDEMALTDTALKALKPSDKVTAQQPATER